MLTNEVVGLAAGEARYAALLTPQGKILFDFLVLRRPARRPLFCSIVPQALAADLAKRLSIYKLRAKVAISDGAPTSKSSPTGAARPTCRPALTSTPIRAPRRSAGAPSCRAPRPKRSAKPRSPLTRR